jgi:hypothetical protein
MRSRKPPLFIRFIAVTLLVAFTASDAAWASPDGISGTGVQNIPTVRLREELGRVETVHRGTGPFLIHIRDAHSNPGAQKNIAEILRLLRVEHGVKTVFLEGGTRDDSLGFLAPRAPLDVRRRVANRFVLSGELSGAELLSVTTDPDLKLLGVEDAALYDRNLRRYAEVRRSRETALADLSRIRQRTVSLKRRHYSKAALEFDEAFRAFRSREASFSTVFLKFQEAGQSSRINALAYPHLLGLARLQTLEEQVDFSGAQKEMARLLSRTTDGLKPSLPALGKFKRGSPAELQFFESLIEAAPAADAGALNAYVAYLRAFSQIDLEKVFGEMESFEDEFFRQTLDSRESRSLHRVGRHLDRLEDLFRMGISQSDFERLQSDAKDIRFRTVSILAFINRLLVDAGRFDDVLEYSPAMDRAREPAEAFYRENDLRDRAIVENAARAIRQSGEKVAALIAGGYHTENLKRLLAERGFSYAVVSPNVEVETNHAQYERVLLEGLDPAAGGTAGLSAASIPPKLILERAAAGARFAAAIQAGTPAPRVPKERGIEEVRGARLSQKEPSKKTPAEDDGLGRMRFRLQTLDEKLSEWIRNNLGLDQIKQKLFHEFRLMLLDNPVAFQTVVTGYQAFSYLMSTDMAMAFKALIRRTLYNATRGNRPELNVMRPRVKPPQKNATKGDRGPLVPPMARKIDVLERLAEMGYLRRSNLSRAEEAALLARSTDPEPIHHRDYYENKKY